MSRLNLSDDELKNFIKSYAPVAPASPNGELASIMAEIENDKLKSKKNFSWFVACGTIAASFATFVLFFDSAYLAKSSSPSIVWEEEASELLGKDAPTNNVGEMYFSLIAMNGNEK